MDICYFHEKQGGFEVITITWSEEDFQKKDEIKTRRVDFKKTYRAPSGSPIVQNKGIIMPD